jgi:hypothetical protein
MMIPLVPPVAGNPAPVEEVVSTLLTLYPTTQPTAVQPLVEPLAVTLV